MPCLSQVFYYGEYNGTGSPLSGRFSMAQMQVLTFFSTTKQTIVSVALIVQTPTRQNLEEQKYVLSPLYLEAATAFDNRSSIMRDRTASLAINAPRNL